MIKCDNSWTVKSRGRMFKKGKMMFQLDDHSARDSLIHVCFDWMTNAQNACN